MSPLTFANFARKLRLMPNEPRRGLNDRLRMPVAIAIGLAAGVTLALSSIPNWLAWFVLLPLGVAWALGEQQYRNWLARRAAQNAVEAPE